MCLGQEEDLPSLDLIAQYPVYHQLLLGLPNRVLAPTQPLKRSESAEFSLLLNKESIVQALP